MLGKTLIVLAAAVTLCTAFLSTEASAWYGGLYGRSSGHPYGVWYGNWGYPYGHCRGYFYSGTYTHEGWFPYAGCDPLKSD
jgi:hypothetical protein